MLSISEPQYLSLGVAWRVYRLSLSLPSFPFPPRFFSPRRTSPPPKPFVSERERLKADTRGAKRQPLTDLRSRRRIRRCIARSDAVHRVRTCVRTYVRAPDRPPWPFSVPSSPAEIRPRECRRCEKIAPAVPAGSERFDASREFRASARGAISESGGKKTK